MSMNQATSVSTLHHTAFYNNRELSWLAFNERVLEEACDCRNPLMERLKFLSIFSSNLDEFFMVRVAGLKDQIQAEYNKPDDKSGLTPTQQLVQIAERTHELTKSRDAIFHNDLVPALQEEGIHFRSIQDLNDEQLQFVDSYFDEQLFPVLTPLAIDDSHPFPKLANKRLNIAVLLEDEQHTKINRLLAIVQVPHLVDRFLLLPSEDDSRVECVLVEDVICSFMDRLFVGFTVRSVTFFRITRNADMTIHEEGAEDLLREIEKELQKRKWGAAVRLEISKYRLDPEVVDFLTHVLEVDEYDLYVDQSPLDVTFLADFSQRIRSNYEHLYHETFLPQPPNDLCAKESIFDAALERDLFFHHPYDSFQPIVSFIQQAASDRHVLAIKQTLYRVSECSPIVEALVQAAENGKQVMVLVEIKARFDEQKNIQWAKRLEEAGAHVIYGLTGLKTHSKITMVVRQSGESVQRFVHIGTGNYNEETAKVYTDVGILTTNQDIAIDATNFFNYLSGYQERPIWRKIFTSPMHIQKRLIHLINNEIHIHRQTGNGKIVAKMNALTDKPLIMKLYEASQAGVEINLIVRGICCLRPGILGISETIRVRSILDRFLEHSRIFYFRQGENEAVYISSADWMTRNMERRVEIMFPVEDVRMKQRLVEILDLAWRDNVKAREQDQSGQYHYVQRASHEKKLRSQYRLFELSYQRARGHAAFN